jgi:hypothetical protein
MRERRTKDRVRTRCKRGRVARAQCRALGDASGDPELFAAVTNDWIAQVETSPARSTALPNGALSTRWGPTGAARDASADIMST